MASIDVDTFSKEVLESDMPVLIDFWGPQCGPCLALMPAVDKMKATYNGRIKLVKVDASQNKRLCLNLKVFSLPTFLFYKNGKEVNRLSGGEIIAEDIESSLKSMLD